jgi:hypothetical protein
MDILVLFINSHWLVHKSLLVWSIITLIHNNHSTLTATAFSVPMMNAHHSPSGLVPFTTTEPSISSSASSFVRATPAQVRRAAGSSSLETLQQALVGWTRDELDTIASQDGKNAVHMAAWQGSLANLQHLVQDWQCSIHTIATGEFCHGKTALFFACTRSRNDIVAYLLDQGAHVKIVNNKGQSVLSIAASHCFDDIVQRIVALEQAQEHVPWINYRATHSDGLVYGDLDPRFLDRELTASDVVTPYAVNPTTKQSRKGSFYQRNPQLLRKEEQKEQPQKVASRKAERKRPELSEEQEKELQMAWNALETAVNGETNQALRRLMRLYDRQNTRWIPHVAERLQSTWPTLEVSSITALLTQPTSISTGVSEASDRETYLLHRLASYLSNDRTLILKKNFRNKPRSPRIPRRRASLSEPLWKDACQVVQGLHMSLLEREERPCLTLPHTAQWVDTTESLMLVENALQGQSLVAIDAEWYRDDYDHMHLATIQLAVLQGTDLVQAFVIDCLQKDHAYQRWCHAIVESLFQRHVVLGFAVGHDIPKLEAWTQASLPRSHVLDLQLLWPKKDVPGLARCAMMHTSKLLSKTEQCSQWGQRPLTASQIEYAGLDAAVLLVILAEQARALSS